MDRPRSYTIFFVFLLIAFGGGVSAQLNTRVSVVADRQQIQLGQPIVLQLKADIPEDEPIQFFDLDSIPHFEFLEKHKVDTTNTNRGTVLTQAVRITSFDSGHWVIPAFVLGDSIRTDSLAVDVVYSGFDIRQDYHDISDVLDVKVEEKKDMRWWYAAGAAFLLLVVIAIVVWKRMRRKPVAAPPVPADPYKEAMLQLDQLKTGGDVKLYYSCLADIFREYLQKKKNIRSLQETTGELVQQMRSMQLQPPSFNQLSQVLRLADFVKFARFIPTPEENAASEQVIRQSIKEIEQIP